MTHGAFGKQKMTDTLDTGPEEMPARIATEQVDAKNAEELAERKFFSG
jgi:hypothetical protein